MRSIFGFCMVVLVFISVNVLAQNDNSSLKSTFQQLENKWNKALISGDAAALANMYTEDAYSMPNNSPMWKGRDAIREGNKKDMQSGTKLIDITSKTVDVIDKGDMAVEIGTYKMTYIPANTTEQLTENGKYMEIWQKQSDGSWKIKADIWNANENPSSTQAGAKEKEDEDK